MPCEHMKNQVLSLVLMALTSALWGEQMKPLQTGKILAVGKRESEAFRVRKPTDAPLASNVVEYEVSVQIGDTVYVGLYQTFTGYLPGTWFKDKKVDTAVDKHFLYLKTPAGEVMRLPLLSHRRVGQSPKTICSVAGPATFGTSIGTAQPV